MATSLASLKRTRPKSNPIALIYGVEKVGKTSLAAQAPNPILIQTPNENVPEGVDIDTFGETSEFATFLDHIEALFVEEHAFQTLVIDSADGLNRLVEAHVCKQSGWQSIEDAGYGKGYVAAADCWANEVMPALAALRNDKGMNVILIAHSETFRFDSPTSEAYARYRPNLPKKVADLIQASAEIIGFMNHRVSIVKEDKGFNQKGTRGEGAGIRMLYLDERPGFIAGNRYSMPSEIKLDKGKGWAEIAKHLPKADA